MTRAGLATLLVAAFVAPALADDTFEQKAASARSVRNVDEIAWALTAACDKGDDTQQRQCRLVRDARAKTELGATLLVDADPAALEIGAFSTAKKSLTLQLSSCIRCTPMQIDGKPLHLTGAAPRIEGGKLRTSWLYDNTRQFADEMAAKAWVATLEGARVQMVIRVPDRKRWQVGGKDGLLVDVIAWRVIIPCTGVVVIASPASGTAEPDRKACPAPTK